MQPTVVQYGLIASSTTVIVNQFSTATTIFRLSVTRAVLDVQRRTNFSFAGNESANKFTIVGLNQANMTIREVVNGTNATAAVSNLDFMTVFPLLL